MRGCLSALALLFSLTCAQAQTLKMESPRTQARLLELYTSEGCSSCPCADRWLSTLTDDRRLWNELVPVAFHVDYWDYMGWSDKYALPAYGDRQRKYARAGNIKTVYTPGFVLNGEEWRVWFRDHEIPSFQPIEVGSLKVDVHDGRGRVVFDASTSVNLDIAQLHMTILGFDLATEVQAGENRGRVLHHDFTVLSYVSTPLSKQVDGFAAEIQLPLVEEPADRMALAVWVTDRRGPEPIQATGGWLSE